MWRYTVRGVKGPWTPICKRRKIKKEKSYSRLLICQFMIIPGTSIMRNRRGSANNNSLELEWLATSESWDQSQYDGRIHCHSSTNDGPMAITYDSRGGLWCEGKSNITNSSAKITYRTSATVPSQYKVKKKSKSKNLEKGWVRRILPGSYGSTNYPLAQNTSKRSRRTC